MIVRIDKIIYKIMRIKKSVILFSKIIIIIKMFLLNNIKIYKFQTQKNIMA